MTSSLFMDQPMSLLDMDLLADAKLDLSSWLFQDDLLHQDFCHGAKDTHFLPSGDMGSASPPFITSQELPDWMETSDDLNWDNPINFEESFPMDIKKCQLFETPSVEPSCQTFSSLFEDDLIPYQSEAPLLQHQVAAENPAQPDVKEMCVYQSDEVQQVDLHQQEILFQESTLSPVSASEIKSPSFFISVQDHFQCTEEIVTATESSTPRIIPVPVAEVFQDQKPTIKTISISNIQYLDGKVNPVLKSSDSSCQSQQPKRIFINLKRISLPVKVVPKVTETVPVQALPTLKDLFSSGEADDLICEMVSPIEEPVVSGTSGNTSDCVYLSDSESCMDDTTTSFMLSPMNHGSCEIEIDSPRSFYVDDFSEEQLSLFPKRATPYSLAERRLRKKEQNKRAALRYRQKKKEEEDTVLVSLQKEEHKHQLLREKFNSLDMEVKLMKKLMMEVLAAKNKKIRNKLIQ